MADEGGLPHLVDLAVNAVAGRRLPQKGSAAPQFMQWWQDPSVKHKLASTRRTALPLIKACGAGKAAGVRILDCTGGWGVDAATLAAAGATVDIIERNPIMAQLLADILQQAHLASDLGPLLRGQVGGLWQGEASAVLHATTPSSTAATAEVHQLWPSIPHSLGGTPPSGPPSAPPSGPWDVLYIDAMFPPRGKASANVKLPAQWLHAIAAQEAIHSLPAEHPARADLCAALASTPLSGMGGLLGQAMGPLATLVGSAAEADNVSPADALAAPLVQAALDSPIRRVVLKRPSSASPFPLPKPDSGDANLPAFSVQGKSVRFDVYQRPWLQHAC